MYNDTNRDRVLAQFVATTVGQVKGYGDQGLQKGVSICERALPTLDSRPLHWISLQQDAVLFAMAPPHRH